MSLTPGTRLGTHEVIAQIGAGGMGEVYRAHDTKLNRDVALKVLPEAFALDGDRIARFRREAQVLASLNHPNIAAIYGFEDSGNTHAPVLELVEGPTLADRIAKGPIPLDEALPIAKQIAEALEAAHEQGIIHRDLKPANIKVRDDGTVKVLDFGLAKAMEPASAIYGAVRDLASHSASESSAIGIALACVSLVVMPLLSRAKRRVGRALESAAMHADAKQTEFCTHLSAILLGGLLLNAAVGLWWADAVAALIMVPIIAKEGIDGFRGHACCD